MLSDVPGSALSTADLPIQEAILDLIRWFIPILHPLPRLHHHGLGPTASSASRASLLSWNAHLAHRHTGSRPAPVIDDPVKPGLPRACRRSIRTAPGGAPPAHGTAIGAGSAPFVSLLP